jgi:hypothetical protein
MATLVNNTGVVLQLTELRSRVPLRGFASSAVVHAVALAIFLLAIFPFANPRRRSGSSFVRVFIPRQERAVAPQKAMMASTPYPQTLPPLPQPVFQPPTVSLDMNAIQISFAEDVTNQLPEVVIQHRGMLALVDKKDPAIAHYLFEPPDWVLHDQIVDISGKVRFAMFPPAKWTLLNSLAARDGLSLDEYQVCALFENTYSRCLRDTIGARAAAQATSPGARVTAARLAFSASQPCGVEVLEVSFAQVR